MKYRIKETVSRDGLSRFYPQYRTWFIWKCFYRSTGVDTDGNSGIVVHDTKGNSKWFISKKIEAARALKDSRTKTTIHHPIK